MMSTGVAFNVEVTSNVTGVFSAIDESLKNLRPLMEKIANEVVRPSIEKSFAAGGRPKWTRLKPGYKKWKDRRRPGAPILTFDGVLRKSIRYRPSARRLVVWTSVPYARFHQTGTRKMVPRPFMRITNAERAEINRMARTYLKGRIDEAKKRGSRRVRKTRTAKANVGWRLGLSIGRVGGTPSYRPGSAIRTR